MIVMMMKSNYFFVRTLITFNNSNISLKYDITVIVK